MVDTKTGKHFEADELLFATGRKPNIEKLNIDLLKIKLQNGFIYTNNSMETSARNVYAAGDVTGEPMLEALAAKEGTVATINAFSKKKLSINKNEIPKAVFTDPEVSECGFDRCRSEPQRIKVCMQCA